MANIYDMVDTWNDGATTFTSIKMNVTDTASASDSLLMDLQVGGADRFKINKDGEVTFTIKNTSGTPVLTLGKAGSSSAQLATASAFSMGSTGSSLALLGSTGVYLDGAYLNIGSGAFDDLRLYRDAANTLAQRNSTNAQTFNLYNTYTDASNYERGFLKWNSNVLKIGTEAAGTGTGRDISLNTNSGRYLTLSNGTTLDTNATYTRFYSGTTVVANIHVDAKRISLGLGGQFTFSSGADSFSTAQDSGIARTAAAQLKITNGSTGTGELIFIVPTSDPGITGALWNNGGTLAISA